MAVEIKWNPRKSSAKCPDAFLSAYSGAEYKVVTPDNLDEFLL